MASDVATRGQAVKSLFQKLALESTFESEEGFTSLSIAEKILAADSEEAIFEAANAGTTAGRDFVGVPFRLLEDNIVTRESNRDDIDGGMKDPDTDKIYYVLLNVTNLETGDMQVINCGSPSIVTTLFALRDGGHMAKYNEEGGMPLVLGSKRAGNGDVLILKPFKAASNAKARK